MEKGQIEEKLLSIFDWIEKTVTQTKDFVTEQTPLVVNELLIWNFTYSLIWFCLGILLIGLAIFSATRINKINWVSDDQIASQIFCAFGVGFSSIFGPILIFTNLDWLKIKLAPRVWLLEYLNDNFIR